MAGVIGFILFNTIFVLLYFIAKVSNKSIATGNFDKYYYECYDWNCWDEEKGAYKENRKNVKNIGKF
ncbi:hypothetical protein CFSAN002367_16788 [Clostridium botulinum CFSAN002367]|nr:hypothetical protein CFSAN002367_16788 [Clostridium botulinum CFSAN002367]